MSPHSGDRVYDGRSLDRWLLLIGDFWKERFRALNVCRVWFCMDESKQMLPGGRSKFVERR